MTDLFPEAFTAADVVAQYDVITILFDVLDAFDHAAPHMQAACLVAVGLVS